jgi:hypothetical protein
MKSWAMRLEKLGIALILYQISSSEIFFYSSINNNIIKNEINDMKMHSFCGDSLIYEDHVFSVVLSLVCTVRDES